MSDIQTVYERLAEQLRRMPNGFPRTQSGVELQLLARMFTPEQAALGSVMGLERASAQDIAARAGVDASAAHATLKSMVRKGLAQAGRSPGGLGFGLLPFVVGSYEESLPYLDAEMARLFEAMLQETHGIGIVDRHPALQRIIPVEQSIDAGIEVLPHEQASALVNAALAWGVRECICRKQQRLIGAGCEHERMNCLGLAPVENAFANQSYVRAIDKDEAMRILHQAEEEGLVHCVANQQRGLYYICNCCECCCAILRGMIQFGQQHALARSDFRARVDAELCTGCGTCQERCHFGALILVDEICTVNAERCMGCGLCATACPTQALVLERHTAQERSEPPVDHRQWQAERLAGRQQTIA